MRGFMRLAKAEIESSIISLRTCENVPQLLDCVNDDDARTNDIVLDGAEEVVSESETPD